MAAQRQACTSVFNAETRQQYFEHPGVLGHNKKINCMNLGDIVILYDKDTKVVFGIGILGAFPNGKLWIETNPIDQELYRGDYIQYNKYEIKAKIFHIEPVSLQEIYTECGIPIGTPIVNGHLLSFKRINLNIRPWINRVLAELFIAEHI